MNFLLGLPSKKATGLGAAMFNKIIHFNKYWRPSSLPNKLNRSLVGFWKNKNNIVYYCPSAIIVIYSGKDKWPSWAPTKRDWLCDHLLVCERSCLSLCIADPPHSCKVGRKSQGCRGVTPGHFRRRAELHLRHFLSQVQIFRVKRLWDRPATTRSFTTANTVQSPVVELSEVWQQEENDTLAPMCEKTPLPRTTLMQQTGGRWRSLSLTNVLWRARVVLWLRLEMKTD